ncbi:N-acetyltransferase ECO1 [Pleurotus pulmonarius]
MTTPTVTRTYGSRNSRAGYPSSPASDLSSSPLPESKRKRPLTDQSSVVNIANPHPTKRLKLKGTASQSSRNDLKNKTQNKQRTLTQLHFCIDTSVLKTCPTCDLSYTKGAPDDEALHRAHCARYQRGLEWGKEEEREATKAGVVTVEDGVRIKNGKRGRILHVRADAGGKIGSKLATLFDTINLALSSPPLTSEALRASKVYLFLLPSPIAGSSRERIVGCVIAQRISTAMAIAAPTKTTVSDDLEPEEETSRLIAVDTTSGLFCDPAPLPTPLGIPRIFVPSTHRRQGIASKLLSAAASTFIHGCPLDPSKGDVAFTQPTGDGNAVMRSWSGNGVRIYEE